MGHDMDQGSWSVEYDTEMSEHTHTHTYVHTTSKQAHVHPTGSTHWCACVVHELHSHLLHGRLAGHVGKGPGVHASKASHSAGASVVGPPAGRRSGGEGERNGGERGMEGRERGGEGRERGGEGRERGGEGKGRGTEGATIVNCCTTIGAPQGAAGYLSSIHSATDTTKYSGTSLSMEDTIGTQLAVLYREVSLIQR